MPGPLPPPLPQAHLDILAQHAGFPDYATWQAWQAHRQAAIVGGSNTTAQPGVPAAPSAPHPAQPLSWYQRLMQGLGG